VLYLLYGKYAVTLREGVNMKTGKLKGACDGCEQIAHIHTDEFGLWLCEDCDPVPTLKIHTDEKTGRYYLTGLGL